MASGESEADDTFASRWCVVANVVQERLYGEPPGELRRGTKHFRPGAKVYIYAAFAGMCEHVSVVGQHRGSNRYVALVMRADHLEFFRAKVVYSPKVLALMDARSGGARQLDTEELATIYAEAFVHWGK